MWAIPLHVQGRSHKLAGLGVRLVHDRNYRSRIGSEQPVRERLETIRQVVRKTPEEFVRADREPDNRRPWEACGRPGGPVNLLVDFERFLAVRGYGCAGKKPPR